MLLSRVIRVWILTFALLVMGMAKLPVPCVGDGFGQACNPAACQCLPSCSCKSVCAAEDALAPTCCSVEPIDTDSSVRLNHFSPPFPQPAFLLALPWQLAMAEREPPPIVSVSRYRSPFLTQAEPPPRLLG